MKEGGFCFPVITCLVSKTNCIYILLCMFVFIVKTSALLLDALCLGLLSVGETCLKLFEIFAHGNLHCQNSEKAVGDECSDNLCDIDGSWKCGMKQKD